VDNVALDSTPHGGTLVLRDGYTIQSTATGSSKLASMLLGHLLVG
jgi:hypothetical protein